MACLVDAGWETEILRLKTLEAVERALPLIAREELFERTPHAALTMRVHVAKLARELALWSEACRRASLGHIAEDELGAASEDYRRFAQVFFTTTATLNLAIERCDEPDRSELAYLLDTGLCLLSSLSAIERHGTRGGTAGASLRPVSQILPQAAE